MNKITAIKTQRRNKERVSVFLDGDFAFGLPMEAATGLQVGQALTQAEIAELKAVDRFDKAKQSAFRYLSYRPRSVAEVERNLQEKGYEEPLVAGVVARLQELELLDDEAFAAYWVEQRETFKPRGRLALRQELRQKGLARPVIERAVQAVDEADAARRAAAKRTGRWSHLPYDQFRQKMGRYLRRRGFNYDVIRDVIRTSWEKDVLGNGPDSQR